MSASQLLEPFFNPVVFVALLIVISVIALIGAAVFGLDKGVLKSMARTEYARGLVTYLFAIVTIGTAVVMVLSGLLTTDSADAEKHFERGKEILSLLLGLFGTIVGFYFGAETRTTAATRSDLRVSALRITAATAAADGPVTAQAVVTGGAPPYAYGIGVGDSTIKVERHVPQDGWITEEISVPTGVDARIHLVVQDDAGDKVERTASAPAARLS